MAVGSGRDVNVIDGPIRENGHGFPPGLRLGMRVMRATADC